MDGQDHRQTPAAGAADTEASASVTSHSAGSWRYLSRAQLAKKLEVSERTSHKVTAEDWFPRAIELAPRVLRWIECEVDAAIAARAPRRDEPKSEPQQLLRGRIDRMKRDGVAA